MFNGLSSQFGPELSSFLVDYRIQTLGMVQPEFMDMTLQLAVARGTARGLINGTAAADYGDVICLRRCFCVKESTDWPLISLCWLKP